MCLSEIKTSYPFGVSGFICIRSRIIAGEEQRGGVAVLFKPEIWNSVYDISREHDQIWFKLYCAPDFNFCAIYITPSDSPYFQPSVISLLQAKAMSTSNKNIVLGDLNARIANLSVLADPLRKISYSENSDKKSNQNGKPVISVCKSCDLKPLNHLIFNGNKFQGDLTYKQGSQWISQLDWCLVSANALPHVASFKILHSSGLPTDHAALSLVLKQFEPSVTDLLYRSKMLGQSVTPQPQLSRRAIPYARVDPVSFNAALPPPADEWYKIENVDTLASTMADTLYETARQSKLPPPQSPNPDSPTPKNSTQRWNKLLKSGDSRAIWRSIDWNGKFATSPDTKESPTDTEFCAHYENLMNPPLDPSETEYVPDCNRYIPILDSPISPNEVHESIKDLNANKAAGVDGLAPGVLKLLTAQWVLLLTFLFNCVFFGTYPFIWLVAKVFNIFKKGDKLDPGNYRGISVMVAIAKLYDMILSRRLQAWYKPTPQQAGAQKGRGCEEQIFVIRLLIDIARKCGFPLYIAFVDYQKAYDKVKRWVLLDRLHKKGCGTTFLMAVAASLIGCMGLIGCEYFNTSAGVRQGASSSCPLFVFFLDATVEAVNSFGVDGWLDTLHCLLLMDDTVVFATSKQHLEAKLRLLKDSADKLGMVIHPTKSKYLRINSNESSPIILDSVIISVTDAYVYLGSIIAMEGISNQVKRHFTDKYCQVLKFYTFLYKNNDAPFQVKKIVWESALKSSIFYGAETWLTRDLKCADSVYMSTLKRLLGVRGTTNHQSLLVESGLPTAKAFVRQKQLVFLQKLHARDQFTESYIGKALTLSVQHKTEAGLVIKELLELPPNYDFCAESLVQMKGAIAAKACTRHTTYLEMNPNLSVSCIYSANVPEHLRTAYTRMRLASHRLRIETGRWSRLPRENRLCQCGEVQTEQHVMIDCPLVKHLRPQSLTLYTCAGDILSVESELIYPVAKLCNAILEHFS